MIFLYIFIGSKTYLNLRLNIIKYRRNLSQLLKKVIY